MLEPIDVIQTRGLDNLPPTIRGRPWQGRRRGNWTRDDMRNMARDLYPGKSIPSGFTKAQLVALIDVAECAGSDGDTESDSEYDNKACPFTLEPLIPPVFVRTTTTGFRRGFSLEELADYILVTGKAEDPVDRESISQTDLEKIDKKLRTHGISKRSVADVTSVVAQARYRQQVEQAETLEIVLDLIAELVPRLQADARHVTTVRSSSYRLEDHRSSYEFRRLSHMACRMNLQRYCGAITEILEQQNSLGPSVAQRRVVAFLQMAAVDAMIENQILPQMPEGVFVDDQIVIEATSDWENSGSPMEPATLAGALRQLVARPIALARSWRPI